MQRLRCIQCGQYAGRYRKQSASTIELELYCHRCKGYTKFDVKDGNLCEGVFIPKTPTVQTPPPSTE